MARDIIYQFVKANDSKTSLVPTVLIDYLEMNLKTALTDVLQATNGEHVVWPKN